MSDLQQPESCPVRKTIRIAGVEIPIIEFKGERVITFKIIDTVHQRPEGTAKRNFNRHHKRFKADKHYFEIGRDKISVVDWSAFGFNKFAPKMLLLTESGYLTVIQAFRSNVNITQEVLNSYFSSSSASVFVAESPESEFGKILKGSLEGIVTVREQVMISDYRVDFLLPEYGVVVEYDEERHGTSLQKKKDNARDNNLTALGYVVVRVKKKEPVAKGLNRVLSIIWKMKTYM